MNDKHHAALDYTNVPAFIARLRDDTVTNGRLALEALVLTATRSGEVRGSKWTEIDLSAATWTIPAERMKANKTHVVALSPEAVDVFRRAGGLRIAEEPLVFPGASSGKPLSDMTLVKIMRDMLVSLPAWLQSACSPKPPRRFIRARAVGLLP